MIKIHQVKTRLVNSYIVEYPDKLLVMDVAIKCHRYVLGFIESELHRPISDVALIICSHDDPDHIGGIAALAKLTHAEVAIPYASRSTWRKVLHDPSGAFVRFSTSMRELLRARAWDMYFNPARNKQAQKQAAYQNNKGSTADTANELFINYRLKHQHALPYFEDWITLHTPGHSWDSCCFFHQQSGSLLSGDTLLGSGKKNRLYAPAIYSNRNDMKQTLSLLGKLNITHVYPGHGSVIKGEHIIAQTKLQ